jgi:hypothetical protein
VKTSGLGGAFGFFLVGIVAGVAAAQLTAGFGLAFPASPTTLPVSLIVIGLAVLIASFPIYRYRKQIESYKSGVRPARPNPFYAVRVMLIARASIFTGALFAGWHLGLVLWLVIFTAMLQSLILRESLSLVAAVLLVVAGYLARRNCKTPQDLDGEAA